MLDYILDNHVHLDPSGKGVDAVREFEAEGGTHLVLSHMPYRTHQVTKGTSYREQYQITLDLAERVTSETGVKVYVALGPYPVDLVYLEKAMGLEQAKATMLDGIDKAARYVEEHEAVALGEIGRPHFKVPKRIIEASNDILLYAMKRAKEISCPVVLHTETATPKNCKEFAEMADKVGLPRERVIKHYCPPLVGEKENHGIMPSILAKQEAVEEALKKGDRFLLETDYLDDPKRPGAVLNITTVPRRIHQLLEKELITEEQVWRICKDLPERLYDVDLDSKVRY